MKINGYEVTRHSHFFVSADGLTGIDTVNPETGLSDVYGRTLADIQQEYPGATIERWEDYAAKKEKLLITAPEEINEERFMYFLEVLPPQNWQHGRTLDDVPANSFELSEHTSGRITQICVQIGRKFYAFQDRAGRSLADNVDKVERWLKCHCPKFVALVNESGSYRGTLCCYCGQKEEAHHKTANA